MNTIQIGNRVSHLTLGEGTVDSLAYGADNPVVNFDDHGRVSVPTSRLAPVTSFQKSKVTVWTDGRFARTELGTVSREDLELNMLHERESHAGFASTLAVEETATTLVVTKENGTVHIYNWHE